MISRLIDPALFFLVTYYKLKNTGDDRTPLSFYAYFSIYDVKLGHYIDNTIVFINCKQSSLTVRIGKSDVWKYATSHVVEIVTFCPESSLLFCDDVDSLHRRKPLLFPRLTYLKLKKPSVQHVVICIKEEEIAILFQFFSTFERRPKTMQMSDHIFRVCELPILVCCC